MLAAAAAFHGLPAAAEDCAGIAADGDRLACYDRSGGWVEAAGRINAGWSLAQGRSELTGAPMVELSTPADAAVPCSFGRAEVPRLVLRCEEDRTSLAIETGSCHVASSPFTDDGEVALRLDSGPVERRGFEADDRNRALGIWDGGAIPIIREMFGHDEMLVRFTPLQRRPVTPRFHVAGLESAIAPLRAACGW